MLKEEKIKITWFMIQRNCYRLIIFLWTQICANCIWPREYRETLKTLWRSQIIKPASRTFQWNKSHELKLNRKKNNFNRLHKKETLNLHWQQSEQTTKAKYIVYKQKTLQMTYKQICLLLEVYLKPSLCLVVWNSVLQKFHRNTALIFANIILN